LITLSVANVSQPVNHKTYYHVISYTHNQETHVYHQILVRTSVIEDYVEFTYVRSDVSLDLALI
jgi:hypothetical protein